MHFPQDNFSQKLPEYELRYKNGMKIWQPRGFKDLSSFESKRKDVPQKSYNTHIASRVQTSEISFGMQYDLIRDYVKDLPLLYVTWTCCSGAGTKVLLDIQFNWVKCMVLLDFWTLFRHRHWFFGLTQVLGDGSWEKSVQQKTGARVIVPSKEIATLKLQTVGWGFLSVVHLYLAHSGQKGCAKVPAWALWTTWAGWKIQCSGMLREVDKQLDLVGGGSRIFLWGDGEAGQLNILNIFYIPSKEV